ncbi:MAG: BamA/TamA family outer membrane protein [Chitinophagaceae bacterium]
MGVYSNMMSQRLPLFILLLVQLVVFLGFSQTAKMPYILTVVRVDTSAVEIPAVQTVFASKNDKASYVFKLQNQLVAQGFATASIDSVWEHGDTTYIALFLGEKYVWKSVRVSPWDSLLLVGLGYGAARLQSLDNLSIQKMQDSVLTYYNNNGYPFASVGMDSIVLQDNRIFGHLAIDKGSLYLVDTIVQNGKAKLTQNFLHRYLEISPHAAYSTQTLGSVSQRLQNLPYVTQSRPWELQMTSTGARLNLYLEPKQVNQIDAVVGFLPANGDLGGKLLLTGQVNLDLQNAFAAGEELKFSWQQLQSRSPRIHLGFARPYMFNSPYGVDFDFELYKRDSLFVNVYGKFGVQYATSSQQSTGIFVQFASMRALDLDTATVLLTKQLPSVMDVSTVSLGVQYRFNNTNYRLNPRRGNELTFAAMVGNRNIGKNETIMQLKSDTFDYASLYDTVKLKSYQYRIVASGAHYFPVGKQAVFKAGLSAGIYQSPNTYVNELFQIGGYKLLRGFDEESIYANAYAVGMAEYRYLIGQNAYFFGFSDVGYAAYNVENTKFHNTYIGLGVGMALQTKAGMLNLSYAVGKRDDTKFDMQKAKIHIGFVSLF